MITGISLAIILLIASTLVAGKNVVNFSARGNDYCKLVFKDCGSVAGKVLNVSFNGTCTSEGFAILKKGTIIVIDFQFQSYNVESQLTSSVHGKIGDLPWVPFSFGQPDACKNSGLVCPVKANTTLDYAPVLDVSDAFPSVTVYVKWELQNKASADVFCVVLLATITS